LALALVQSVTRGGSPVSRAHARSSASSSLPAGRGRRRPRAWHSLHVRACGLTCQPPQLRQRTAFQ